MKKTEKERRDSVIEMLKRQEIRDVSDIESYKLSVCHGASAGIDLGSRSNYVAISPEIAAEMGVPIVREFSTLTSGHQACRDYLLSCGIKYVSMESTSVYWMNLYGTNTLTKDKLNNRGYNKYLSLSGNATIKIDYEKVEKDAKLDGNRPLLRLVHP